MRECGLIMQLSNLVPPKCAKGMTFEGDMRPLIDSRFVVSQLKCKTCCPRLTAPLFNYGLKIILQMYRPKNNSHYVSCSYMHQHILLTRSKRFLIFNFLIRLKNAPFCLRLSGLEFPLRTISSEPTSPLEKVKTKLQDHAPSSSSRQNNATKVQVQEVTLPVPESTLQLIAQKHRKK